MVGYASCKHANALVGVAAAAAVAVAVVVVVVVVVDIIVDLLSQPLMCHFCTVTVV